MPKRKSAANTGADRVRINVTLTPKVHAWMIELREEAGHGRNTSGLIGELIRRERERVLEKKSTAKATGNMIRLHGNTL